MKHRLSSIAAVTFAALLSALVMTVHPAQAQTCANVEVQNVRPEQGMLMIAAYADAAGFANKASVAALQMRPGPATTMTFPLCGLTGGSVALTLFQDLNGNGKLDANVLGIPTEPWGASGKPAAMSAPTWETTVVPLDGTTIVVKLSNMKRLSEATLMNTSSTITRRDALLALAALGAGAGTALPGLAATAPVASEGAAFDAAVADAPWLAPFKGLDDRDPSRTDLRCESLSVTGRWPAELRGRFYRNGPALFERAGQRYHHWFDGDGMVQQFTFSGRGVSHVGRLVRTPKLAAEREAGRFLYPTFGTGIQSEAPTQGPDSINVANTNAIEHAGRVLAMWEGGSAYALDPKDLSTLGR